MQEELNQFERNNVWELVEKLENYPVIGRKWVFRNKLDENGIVIRNKRDLPPPPPLLATAAMEPLKTHQHQFFPLFHLLGHPHYFPLMTSVRGTSLNSVIESF